MARGHRGMRRGGHAAAPFALPARPALAAGAVVALACALAACGGRVGSAAPAPPPDPAPPAALDLPCTAPCGELTLRYVLGDAGPFTSLVVRPYWGGANDDRLRARGWTGFTPRRDAVLLHPRVPVAVFAGPLPAGHWHRVLPAALEVHGRLRSGRRVRLRNHIEPIARGFDLADGQRLTVDVELIVMAAPGGADSYEVFVRDAWLVEAPHAP